MNQEGPEFDGMIVAHLSYWTQRLVQILLEVNRLQCDLANCGVVGASSVPRIFAQDRPEVVRIKEHILLLDRERREIRRAMAGIGARLLDQVTWEVLLPGGPLPGSYLSWQPGEENVEWWRAEPSAQSKRRELPARVHRESGPTLH